MMIKKNPQDELIETLTIELLKNNYLFSRSNTNLSLYKPASKLLNAESKEPLLKETTSALKLIFEEQYAKGYRIDLSSLNDMDLFQTIYHKLSNKDAKTLFTDFLAKRSAINLYSLQDSLQDVNSKIKSSTFLNDLIVSLYNDTNSAHKSYYSIIKQAIELHNKKENFSLEEKTLLVLCKDSRYILKDIANQNLLKNFVTENFPQKIEKLKKYWKKVDTSKLTEDDCISEGFGATLSFNKIYLHNLNANNPEDNLCLKRLRALVTCLNKTNIQSLLQLKKTTIDGIAASEKNYNFFFSMTQSEFTYKELLKKVVIEVAQNTDCALSKNIEKVINFELLNSKVNNKVNSNSYSNKSSLKI